MQPLNYEKEQRSLADGQRATTVVSQDTKHAGSLRYAVASIR